MAPNDTSYIANTIINSDIPVPWCEEFEKMINGKKFVHDLALDQLDLLTESLELQLHDVKFGTAHGIQAFNPAKAERIQ